MQSLFALHAISPQVLPRLLCKVLGTSVRFKDGGRSVVRQEQDVLSTHFFENILRQEYVTKVC